MWKSPNNPPEIVEGKYWAMGFYESRVYPVVVAGVNEWQKAIYREHPDGRSHWSVQGFNGNWIVLKWFDMPEWSV